MESKERQASPIEMAALLMNAVCAPSNQEQDALKGLAVHLDVPLPRMQSELLYLRAFAVDLAAMVCLADSPEKEATLQQYNRHWEYIEKEAGQEVLDELKTRVEFYAEVASDDGPHAEGLRGAIGEKFADHCQTGAKGPDLAVLGGSMFAALFDEVADLFNTVEIVLGVEG